MRKSILLLFPLFLITGCWLALNLKFEHVQEKFIPSGDKDFEFLDRYNKELEEDEISLFVAIDHGQSIFDTTFLQQVDDFARACKSLPHIQEVKSITQIEDYIKVISSMGGTKADEFFPFPLVHLHDQSKLAFDSTEISKDPRFMGVLVSNDFEVTNVIIKTFEELSQEESTQLCMALDSLLEASPFDKVHAAGKVLMQHTFVETAKSEILFYIVLFCGLLVLMLLAIYRSFWGTVVPLVSVIGGLIFFFAYMKISGQSLDIMATLFPTLMLIFGMADIIHLQTKYIDLMEQGKTRMMAMSIALREIGMALFLTSLTTGIGFASLVTSQVSAVRTFGINAAAGVMIAYITVVVFASCGLLLFNKSQLSRAKDQWRSWKRLLHQLYRLNRFKPSYIVMITVLVTIISIFGIYLITTNSYLAGEFPRSGKLRSDYLYFEEKFSGNRSLEIAILPQDGYLVTSPEVLRETDKLESYLRKEQGLQNLYSPVTVYQSLNKAYNQADLAYLKLPDSDSTLKSYTEVLKMEPRILRDHVISRDSLMGRITGKMDDPGSDVITAQNKTILAWVDENIDTDIVKFRFTGISLMVDKNNEYMISSLFKGLILAFVVVGLLFAFIFRDPRMILVSLIPNVLPLIIAGGVMGFLGIELKATTSVIFTISFGIAVDDTIHFLTRYKLEQKKGYSINRALITTFQVSGKAIILTTLILVVGFISLILSEFSGTFYIGILISITLVSAMLSDLFIIPQLIYMMNPGSRKRQRAVRQETATTE